MKLKIPVDLFLIVTDNETNAIDNRHASEILKSYRQKMGIDAKMIVAGMTANDISIADPKDAGMMDIAGFDSALPKVISEFVKM